MKKIGLIALLLSTAAVLCILVSNLKTHPVVRIPSGASEENKTARAEWERQRLADPATGIIPEGMAFLERWFAQSLPQAAASRFGVGWMSRGPWNVGGRSRALAIDVNNENRLMAGGVSGGVWLSNDGGQNWTRTTALNAHPGCVSIAQDRRAGKTNTWYYLSGEIYAASAGAPGAFYLGDGLYRSLDNGQNWNSVGSTAAGNPNTFSSFFQSGWRVVTSPDTTADVLYMATLGAIYRSTNGGNAWTAVRGGNTADYSYFTDVAISSTGVLYATLSSDGPHKGIWRSTNGTSWTDITPANFPAEYNRIVIGINPDNENEVYFLGETPGSGHYNHFIDSDDWSSLWKYNYLGGSGANGQWNDLTANMPDTGTEFDKFACQGGYDLVVKVQPGTGNVFIGGTNIYRSTDGFTSPNNSTHIAGYKPGTTLPFFELYPNHHPDQHEILFLPSNPNVMLTASDGGLHRSENCNAPTVEWSTLNHGYHTAQFYTAMIEHTLPGDNTIIGGLQDNGNFFSNNAEVTALWKQTVNGDGSYGAILDGKSSYVLSIHQGRVAKCALDADGNVTAFRRIDPIGPVKADYQFINPLALDPTDQNVLYLPAGRKLYRQDQLDAINLTGEWDSISQGWTQFPDTIVASAGEISAIAVSRSNPAHRVYIGTSLNKLYRIDDAHTGTPGFTTLAIPPAGTGNVNCIAVDPDDADRAVVVYSNYNIYSLFLTTNGGQTWVKVAGNLEVGLAGTGNAPSLRWLSILPFPDGSRKYFCGTSVGLYSADTLITHSATSTGTQWVLEGAGTIGSAVVNYIEVRPVDGLVVAATHGSGIFAANFMPSSTTNTPPAVKVQISPNPVSDYADIRLNSDETAEFVVYDMNGARILGSELRNRNSRVNLTGLPAGVYVYAVRQNGQTTAGKLLKQ